MDIRSMYRYFRVGILVSALLLGVHGMSGAQGASCSCGNLGTTSCSICSTVYGGDPHTLVDTYWKEYDPSESGEIHTNVLAGTSLAGGLQNESPCPIIADVTMSASITENRTVGGGAAVGGSATVAAEAGFGICKAGVSYTGSFEVSGEYSQETGLTLGFSATVKDVEIAPGYEAYWEVKKYKKTVDVSVTAERMHFCFAYHSCPPDHEEGIYYPREGNGDSSTIAYGSEKYTEVKCIWKGTRPIA